MAAITMAVTSAAAATSTITTPIPPPTPIKTTLINIILLKNNQFNSIADNLVYPDKYKDVYVIVNGSKKRIWSLQRDLDGVSSVKILANISDALLNLNGLQLVDSDFNQSDVKSVMSLLKLIAAKAIDNSYGYFLSMNNIHNIVKIGPDDIMTPIGDLISIKYKLIDIDYAKIDTKSDFRDVPVIKIDWNDNSTDNKISIHGCIANATVLKGDPQAIQWIFLAKKIIDDLYNDPYITITNGLKWGALYDYIKSYNHY